ncbi:Asp-tRNA(Asn)/Glu-tRNA(Gln) amidotransferase subunit GatC [Formicincola oecophyllae]|uniref:Aspartyl/glutamyl-tRNA(Asn/Gln) amidotransferase subunit C n=1 Tax=Formicincola oecophyllae TaxID=2558361 RepID=A0A4Y6UCK2_9PROT|nr:Asp-tRNA(Asn)/Glu-tRNA(Gln) amidotransferase subunit GatC [Formicincola oecophyllae]QDH14177.1 Asp-tRNA(Asn)/Glu-tRNA(Gln) amidotransferase subunit GatC [Formicincola oecophyllae]
MALDDKAVAHIAKLARIGLAPEEVAAFRQQMEGIVEWVGMLEEVNIAGVPPMVGTGLATPRLRADEVTNGTATGGDCREAVLENAPDRVGPYYTVPKVVE